MNEVHYNSYVDPYAGHDYVEIGGIKWATMNVGANSITDTGLYFQWGDTQGYTASQVGNGEGQKYFGLADYKYYDDGSYTKYNNGDGLVTLQSGDDAVQANWGGSWRMPTTEEFSALGTATTSAWTDDHQSSGVAGLVLTSKSNGATLFFPACGGGGAGGIFNVGSSGNYWSGSFNVNYDGTYAYSLSFHDAGKNWQNSNYRHYGFPIRGVVD